MPDTPDPNPLDELADSFIRRIRNGERPALSEYADRHPELAGEIRELFPALVMMNQLEEDLQHEEPESPADEPTIRQLGDFRIIREAGRGGMGIVYEAEQVSLGRRVALKVLPSQTLLDPKHKKRFIREAKAAARLHHTNIVPVFGVGEQEGLHYYVMQFIPGLGLDEVLVELRRQRAESLAEKTVGVQPSGCSGQAEAGTPTFSAAAAAHSLVSGRFERTLLVESGSEGGEQPSSSTVDPGHPTFEPSADPQPSTIDHTTAVGRLSETLPGSAPVPLPGQSEQTSKAHLRNVYWQSVARIGVQAADALQYAHDQGIIHRDVKPGNLLLDASGSVWITDFGLAKAADQQDLTHTGDVLGTLRYMAPEQFEGNADARSDVFSLGLTLYELLAMQPAFDASDRQRLIKQVTTGTPARLRAVDSNIPRDLETIVHKAIDRDPSHRYQTAGELAADLQRFLGDEPIRARWVSPITRFHRWCKRNPMGATVTLLLALLAVGGPIVAANQIRLRRNATDAATDASEQEAEAIRQSTLALANEREANEQRQRAEENLRKARQAVDEMYTQVAEKWLAQQPQMDAVQREFLEKALVFYTDFAQTVSADPAVRFETAQAFRRVAEIQHRFGRPGEAEEAFGEAIDRLQALDEEFPDEPEYRESLADSLHRLGVLLGDTGRHPDGLQSNRRALELQEKLLAQFPDDPRYRYGFARGQLSLGNALDWAGVRSEERRELFRQGIAVIEEFATEFPDDPEYRQHLVEGHQSLRNFRDAIAIAEELVAEFPENPEYRSLLADNIYWHAETLPFQDSEPLLIRAIDLQRKLVAEFPSVSDYRYNLLRSLLKSGGRSRSDNQPQEAEVFYREGVEIGEKLVAESPTVSYYRHRLSFVYNGLAIVLGELHRWAEASEAYSRLIELQPDETAHLLNRGRAFLAAGDDARAQADFDAYLQPFDQEVEEQPDQWREAYNNLAILLGDSDRWTEVSELYSRLIELQPDETAHLVNRGRAFLAAGDDARAQADFDAYLQPFDQAVEEQPDQWETWNSRGVTLTKLDRWEAAALDFRQAAELVPENATPFRNLAACQTQQSRWHEASGSLLNVVGLEEAGWRDLYELGLCSLAAGNLVRYHDVCHLMLAVSGESLDPLELSFAAWTSSLASSLPDEQALALATKAVTAQPENDQFLSMLGAVLYRAGRYDEAVQRLTELSNRREQSSSESNSSPAYAWYFLAMANHALGQSAEAQTWLDHANQWTNQVLDDETDSPPWNRRLTLELLREQATTLVGASPTEDASSTDASDQPPAAALPEQVSDLNLVLALGRHHVRHGRWDSALAEYEVAVDTIRDNDVLFEYACLLVLNNHEERYRQLCDRLVTELLETDSAELDDKTAWVVKTCTLHSNPGVAPEQILRWAEGDFRSNSDKHRVFRLGLASLRADQFEEAARWLEESLGSGLTMAAAPLALAFHRLDRAEDAQRCLQDGLADLQGLRSNPGAWLGANAVLREAAGELGEIQKWRDWFAPSPSIVALHRLKGHTGSVTGVAFSQTGQQVISASGWPAGDQTLRLWDADSGDELRRLEGHEDQVRAAAFTSDGSRVVSSGEDGEIRVWDAETGEELQRLSGHAGKVVEVSLTSDDRLVLTAGEDDHAARLWDLESGRELQRLDHPGRVAGAVISFDGRRGLTVCSDKIVRLWDLESGTIVHEMIGHTRGPNSVALHPSGKLAVSSGYEPTIYLWDLESGEQVGTFNGHSGGVHVVVFTPDGNRVITGGGDHTIRLWDLATRREISGEFHGGCDVQSIDVSRDGRQIVSAGGADYRDKHWEASGDFDIRVWSIVEHNESERIE